jgi:hypothetical protein
MRPPQLNIGQVDCSLPVFCAPEVHRRILDSLPELRLDLAPGGGLGGTRSPTADPDYQVLRSAVVVVTLDRYLSETYGAVAECFAVEPQGAVVPRMELPRDHKPDTLILSGLSTVRIIGQRDLLTVPYGSGGYGNV